MGLLLAVVAAARFATPVLFTLALAAPGLDAWIAGSSVPAREEIVVRAGETTLRADLYRPRHPRSAVLLVHGLSPKGRRHPELVRLARLFARHGRLVLVPHFDGLADFRLGGREVEEVKAALAELRRRSETVAVAGFSFGAGPALVAAAGEDGLAWVGSFGGYADLRNVIVFLTTGNHSFQGRRHASPVEDYNRWKLASLLAPLVDDPRDRERMRAIAARRLADPAADTAALAAELRADGRTVMRLVQSRDEAETTALVERLSPAARAQLDRLSPLAAVPAIRARLLVAHGVDDDSIPFTESLRLAGAAGGRARVVILESFHHTGPRPAWWAVHRVTDGAALLGLVSEMLISAPPVNSPARTPR